MANWAAYKETEIGLPVVKRAKHGIHFDAGKGLVRAEFVGKPCHYFDGKEYRAIDTKPLLRKDGTYGCAHSDVIIHTDGTVQVGDYTQRAALIYPGKISVDGDRIARPFSGGVQYLYITENGFRQEIVLEKMPDLRKVSALVDSVKGILPTKYTASSLSLKDSSTAELSDFVQADSKSLASVLEAAKYPVVIDPDFQVTTGTGRDTSLLASFPLRNYGASNTIFIASNQCALLLFDISSILVTENITEVLFKITSSSTNASSFTSAVNIYSVAEANGDWVEGTKTNATAGSGEPCWNAKAADGSEGVTTAWAGSAGCATSGTDYESTLLATLNIDRSDATNTLHTFTFNADGITRVNGWRGATNTNYGIRVGGTFQNTHHSGEAATESYRPVLTVTYSAAATGHAAVSRSANVKFMHGYRGVR